MMGYPPKPYSSPLKVLRWPFTPIWDTAPYEMMSVELPSSTSIRLVLYLVMIACTTKASLCGYLTSFLMSAAEKEMTSSAFGRVPVILMTLWGWVFPIRVILCGDVSPDLGLWVGCMFVLNDGHFILRCWSSLGGLSLFSGLLAATASAPVSSSPSSSWVAQPFSFSQTVKDRLSTLR